MSAGGCWWPVGLCRVFGCDVGSDTHAPRGVDRLARLPRPGRDRPPGYGNGTGAGGRVGRGSCQETAAEAWPEQGESGVTVMQASSRRNLHDDRRNEAVTSDDTKATLASFHRFG